jgi:hypothetical protein
MESDTETEPTFEDILYREPLMFEGLAGWD